MNVSLEIAWTLRQALTLPDSVLSVSTVPVSGCLSLHYYFVFLEENRPYPERCHYLPSHLVIMIAVATVEMLMWLEGRQEA